jgi:hypothetical protein
MYDEEVTEAVANVVADEIADLMFSPARASTRGLPQADAAWTCANRPGLPRNVAVIDLTDGREVWVTATAGQPDSSELEKRLAALAAEWEATAGDDPGIPGRMYRGVAADLRRALTGAGR